MKHLEINFDDWDIEEEDPDGRSLTDKAFVRFLEEHDAYDKFIYNYNKYSYYPNIKTNEYCNYIKSIDRSDGYIYSAFDWEKTKEGYDYWEELSYYWS